ncbi:NADH-quinone oxidoreductase subunit K [Devosia chinhatensis]|uniref:Monovalent cation/H+ antiporter subunit C n=1 Tax=Devosia chinhatensis TaxID=429727 RepID=A0A0F5FIW3_9HYPH|nr:NADH-quinone oxidoreductase subunit K [Devosia chinhatensis]KKB08142.1 monovalent cation/H+ antiporter subunit C [Devosia chinhatensis]
MTLIFAAGIAAIMGCGIYMLLSRHTMRILLGVMLMSAGVNLVIFLAGRIGPNPPPLIETGAYTLVADAANPLPQALVLTAIVIGFSLVAFAAALALQTFRTSGTLDQRDLGSAEALGSPYDKEAGK